MADTKIEDLPTLDPADYNPLTDFMIIQKPGGGTFKMLAGAGGVGGGGSSAARTSYIDSASIGGAYTGGFHYNNTYTQNFGSIEFYDEGLLNSASTFVINISLSNMNKGDFVNNRSTGGRSHKTQYGPETITDKSFRFIKTANIDLVNNTYSTDSTQTFTFFDREYAVSQTTSSKSGSFTGWRTNSAKLTCDLVFDQSSDSITFSNITLTHYNITFGRDARYSWPRRVDIAADINANIGF